jgi:hypothetical protein
VLSAIWSRYWLAAAADCSPARGHVDNPSPIGKPSSSKAFDEQDWTTEIGLRMFFKLRSGPATGLAAYTGVIDQQI